MGFGIGPGATGGPFAALFGPWALFVWLRLIVGLVFPLVVSWAALQTGEIALDGVRDRACCTSTWARSPSGTILAAGLYFGAGLLV